MLPNGLVKRSLLMKRVFDRSWASIRGRLETDVELYNSLMLFAFVLMLIGSILIVISQI